jgi:hypothetical protein
LNVEDEFTYELKKQANFGEIKRRRFEFNNQMKENGNAMMKVED